MKTYIEIVFDGISAEQREILIAELAEAGFDGFLEEENSLKAYQDKATADMAGLESIAATVGCVYRVNEIAEENWNASWEASFEPVIVEDFVAVRADFHDVVRNVEYEIVITPKMSFGTGHHATTWLMMKAMRDLATLQKSTFGESPLGEVVDYGTGTGILAILAEKMGAGHVLAIDNDTWSIDNATENLSRNGCNRVELELGEAIPAGKQYDLVLANINKHILIGNCEGICAAVKPGGYLLLSGILKEDLGDMEHSFGLYLGKPVSVKERNNWLMIAFYKALTV